MNQRSKASMTAAGALFLVVQGAAAEPHLIVGFLEDAPAARNSERPKPRVRVVFRYTAAGGWEAYPNDCLSPECLARITSQYPHRMTWVVSLAGLTVGTVASRTPEAFHSLQEIGLQDLVSKGPAPFIGKPSVEYAGAVSEPVRRPLLVTRVGHKPRRSLGGWKESAPEPEDLDRVWPVFRRLVPLIDNCPSASQTSDDTDANADAKAKPETDAPASAGRHPKKLELEIPVAWVARSGDALLRVAVRQDIYAECDGPRSYPRQLWFYRDAQGRVAALPGQLADDRGDLVAPLEFTDLLHDGHEEVLFQAASHDRGGYVLYYDRFRKNVTYLWNFH